MKLGHLTVGQLREAMRKHPYLMVSDGHETCQYAINSKIMNTAKMKLAKDEQISKIIGWRSISFQEYISNKIGFLPKPR